jgi:hypothetical protein
MRNLSDPSNSYCSRMPQTGSGSLGKIGNGKEDSEKRELKLYSAAT